jgi:hypothetical protein
MSKVSPQLIIAIILITLGVASRLLPHEANFAPIGAIALFGGVILGWKHALWLPLSAMIISDLFIGFYSGIGFTWVSFVLIALFGMTLKKAKLGKKIVVGGVVSASIFFVVSNFGVWVSSGMYSHTLAGLIQCYTMAIPFFRMTLLSDLFYSGALFGLNAFAIYLVAKYSKVSSQSPYLH